jgi:hypothetical protein
MDDFQLALLTLHSHHYMGSSPNTVKASCPPTLTFPLATVGR